MSDASEAAHAYRLGLMGPKSRAEYEDAVKQGIVSDRYASGRMAYEAANPAARSLAGGLETAARSVPGLSEVQAAIPATIATARDALAGKGVRFGPNWTYARDRQQVAVDDFRAQHPMGSDLATGAGYAGQALAALATGGGAAAPALEDAGAAGIKALAARLGGAGARNATVGATYAAAAGAGQPGSFSARIRAAKQAILPGAVLGAAVPAALGAGKALATQVAPFLAKRSGAVVSELTDAAGRALSGKTPYDQAAEIPPETAARGQTAALDYLRQLGATPEGLRAAALDAGGKPLTTAEAVGPVGISQATGISRRAGTAPAVADAVLRGRAADRGQRVLADIEEHTGIDPSAARGHIDALVDHGRKMAGPLFDAVRKIQGPIMTPELAQWAETPIGKKALASAATEIRNIPGGDPMAHGLPIDPDTGLVGGAGPGLDKMELQPTAATWDLIRKHVGDQVERDAFGKIIPDSESRGNYAVNANKQALTQILAGDGKTSPGLLAGYRDALDQSGDYLGIQSAFNNGKGMLFGRSTRADPASFAKWHAGLKPIEQEAVKASAANDILTAVQNGTLRPGSFSLPHVQSKLTTLFGKDATDKLTKAMDAEAKMAAAEARMRPNMNSVTGDTVGALADQSDPAGDAALKATGHLLTLKPGRAVKSLAGGLSPYISAGRQPFDMAARNAFGDLLYADPADVAHLLEMHQAASVPAVAETQTFRRPSARMAALLAGANEAQDGQ